MQKPLAYNLASHFTIPLLNTLLSPTSFPSSQKLSNELSNQELNPVAHFKLTLIPFSIHIEIKESLKTLKILTPPFINSND